MDRNKQIIRTSLIGIFVNFILVIFKTVVGIITNSIAIILDAVNNLSDALSSVITIIGTKLAGKKPDKKHPFGHGRVEYLTSVLIAVIMLTAGVTSLKESVIKTINPEPVSYTGASLVIIAAAVLAKLFIGRYVKGKGKELNSGALIAAGTDAFFDAVLSFATLVAAVLNMSFGIGVEGILGAVISLIIIKSGFGILVDTLSGIIGARADAELAKQLKETVTSFDNVCGAYDLTLHNYGPTQIIGSVHIEVPPDMTAKEIHILTRHISVEVYNKYGIILTVGIYASSSPQDEFAVIKRSLDEIVAARPDILQMHGFFGDADSKRVMFDLIIDFDADAERIRAEVAEELMLKYPQYRFDIILDNDFSD